jgi:hypothetical protein
MYYVNENFRIWYATKEFTTGLNNIQLLIIKPDDSAEGMFIMNEYYASSTATGCYYYDFIPTLMGKYLFMIICPTDSAKQVASEIFVQKEILKPVVRFS